MLCITNNITDPYFNLASEEFLLKNFSDDVFMLYQDEPSVIVGKHQNAFAEVNYWYAKEKNIKVARRLSGGGTVFHDMGNLNFCFIRNGQAGNLVNFRSFTAPIINALHNINVPAEYSGRNDLLINGLKFSGNAEHVYKNRTLHHGTILFSSQLDALSEVLKVNGQKYQDKAVKSVPSKVTNVTHHLLSEMCIEEFKKHIFQSVVLQYTGTSLYTFSSHDTTFIKQLVNDKYSTWEWNYGYSPGFKFKNEGIVDGKKVEVSLVIEKGIVIEADIKVNSVLLREVSQELKALKYKEDIIRKKLQQLNVNAESWISLLL